MIITLLRNNTDQYLDDRNYSVKWDRETIDETVANYYNHLFATKYPVLMISNLLPASHLRHVCTVVW